MLELLLLLIIVLVLFGVGGLTSIVKWGLVIFLILLLVGALSHNNRF